MSGIKKTFKELPGWIFDLDEISAGVYRVHGVDEGGRSVDMTGTDPDALMNESKDSALKMSNKGPNRI